jgi:uncharacterized OB-fold protein
METQPFWDGLRDGKFLLKHCTKCGRDSYYPRPFCPYCWGDELTWVEASGRGTLYTYSVVHVNDLPPFNERVPYVAAIVELEEGPRVMTNIEDVPFDELRIGMDVVVSYRAISDDVTIPVFRAA